MTEPKAPASDLDAAVGHLTEQLRAHDAGEFHSAGCFADEAILISAGNLRTVLSALSSQSQAAEGMAKALEECREYLDRFSDVIDGDYGVPEPNEAMQLVHEIDRAFGGDRK